MRTLVFADVHGNLPAFEAMLRHVGSVDRYVSLGDVVNYGPWSDECVALLETLPHCDKVMGNHDKAFLTGHYSGDHRVARSFFEFCAPRFRSHAMLARYVDETKVGAFRACHTLDDRYIFSDTPVTLDADYLIGHSHHQFCIRAGGYVLYNAGSVGQNRRHLDVINYLLVGPGECEVELCALPYDPAPVIAEMRARGYPDACLDYYLRKPRIHPA